MTPKKTESVTLKHFPGNGKPETTRTVEMQAFEQNGRREDYKTGFKFPHPSKAPSFYKG